MLNRGQLVTPPASVPSPASASPTAGINPQTLQQLLGLYMKNMSQPRQAPQLPPMQMARRGQRPPPQAFNTMQRFQRQ